MDEIKDYLTSRFIEFEIFFDKSSPDDYYIEEIQEIASLLVVKKYQNMTWRYILDNLHHVESPVKRDSICIGVFEMAAANPDRYGWIPVLEMILINKIYYWVIIRSYKNLNKKMLYNHLNQIYMGSCH